MTSWNLDLFQRDLRFSVLGSGSRGNASVVWSGDDAVLVDCGLPARRTIKHLCEIGVDPEKLKGVFLTHEHSDHIGGVDVLARKLGVPVFCTPGTRDGLRLSRSVAVHTVEAGRALRIGGLDVEPFRVNHDVPDPVGFVVGAGVHRVGFATDMGSVRESVVRALRTCRAALLEFNHDEYMLRHGEYPTFLKRRVASDLGHLSNRQGAALLGRLLGSRLEHVLLGHLSLKNNRADLALSAAHSALEGSGQAMSVTVAEQGAPSEVLRLHDGDMPP